MIKDINAWLDLCHRRYLQKCPAPIARYLTNHGTPAKAGKPITISAVEAGRHLSRVISDNELIDLFRTDKTLRIPEGATRQVLARLMGNEKASRLAVREKNQSGHFDIWHEGRIVPRTAEDILSMSPKSVILVENRENFQKIDKISFEIPRHMKNAMVLYRGDPQTGGDVKALLNSLQVDVYAYPDYDPAGLVQSLALPFFKAILWPGEEALRAAIENGGASAEKYMKQLRGARNALEAASHPDVVAIWSILKQYGKTPSQEFFLQE